MDPDRLKGALLFPNLKDGGKRSDPASWRPISHTSQLSLIFERYVKDILINNLETYGLIGDHQFGFRKNRSCLAQLLRFYNKALCNLESGANCDIIYLDFAKAFDKVDITSRNAGSGVKWGFGSTASYLTIGSMLLLMVKNPKYLSF